MKIFGLAAVIAAGLSSAAFGADQSLEPYAPVPVAPIYNWNGTYLGIHVGYGWAEYILKASSGPVSASVTEKLEGVVGGVQAGMNHQMGNFVLGYEVDATFSNQEYRTTVFGTTITDSIPYLSTLRLRAGVAMDRVLIYGTAGAGYGQFRTQVGPSTSNFATEQRWLGVGGAGIEFALGEGWSAKAEGLYLHSTTKDRFVGGIRVSDHATDLIARLGLNYRFNLLSGPPPH